MPLQPSKLPMKPLIISFVYHCTTFIVSCSVFSFTVTLVKLASCLINAQPLPTHRPAADDNSFIGCTRHDLTDDWLLPSAHFIDS